MMWLDRTSNGVLGLGKNGDAPLRKGSGGGYPCGQVKTEAKKRRRLMWLQGEAGKLEVVVDRR